MQAKLKEIERNPGTYALPVRLEVADMPGYYGSPIVEIKPGGIVNVKYRGWGYQPAELNQVIRDQILAYFDGQMPKHDYFWRGTNSKDEIELIKRGEINCSLNHADGHRERGLSVADGLHYVMMQGYKYGYRIRGIVIGHGSDGEPVLDISTLEPVDGKPRTVKSIASREEKAYFKAQEQALKAAGWTVEQYRAAWWTFTVPAEDYDRDWIQD
jgi:hypothetical protein